MQTFIKLLRVSAAVVCVCVLCYRCRDDIHEQKAREAVYNRGRREKRKSLPRRQKNV